MADVQKAQDKQRANKIKQKIKQLFKSLDGEQSGMIKIEAF